MIAVALLGVSDNASCGAALLLIFISLLTAVGGFFGERLRLTDDEAIAQYNN